MDDDKITELFFARSEDAIGESERKYVSTCRAVAYNILKNREDAEECVNDAYLAVWNSVPPERPVRLRAFVFKFVRNISLKRYEKNTARKRNSNFDVAIEELEDCIALPSTVEDEFAADETAKLIGDFLSSFPKENRQDNRV